ncbi:hypothetical protein PG994_007670 [Apiospora phragmitis]|uniref:Uncharacterized protein n=1 Tax=Apiospora phragmitis TaxID=2905665 RepID=A0ABR1UQV2_9PEZI
MAEARKPRTTLPHYPTISSSDKRVSDEPTTVSILSKWNHTIVNAALEAVQSTLHTSVWTQWKGLSNWQEPQPRDNKPRARKGVPDGGAIAACESNADNPDLGRRAKERLPKDYKPAAKWHSGLLWQKELIDQDGKWKSGTEFNNHAMPIKQAFTYCLEKGCRYGCIISTQEAFIFHESTEEELRGCLSRNGLMEYVSVPWKRRFPENSQEPRVMTINLALWFVHTLAGNSHRVDWSYPSLAEKLVELPCSHAQTGLETPVSEPKEQNRSRGTREPSFLSSSQPRKRARQRSLDESNESEGHEGTPLFTSFNPSEVPARQSRQSFASDSALSPSQEAPPAEATSSDGSYPLRRSRRSKRRKGQ